MGLEVDNMLARRGNFCEGGAEAVANSPGSRGSDSSTDHQPRRQGDDDVGNQLLGWEQRLGLVEKSIENI